MIVNGNTGVDACVLRHQITDLQQDVAGVPAGGGGGTGRWRRKTMMERDQDGIVGRKKPSETSCCKALLLRGGTVGFNHTHLMSMVKRLLLLTGFWSGPFRVTVGLGRPQTLQQSTTVSPNAHTTSDRGLRNSGATARTEIQH